MATDPKTKEAVLNRMLSYDFSGDIRQLGINTRIERIAPHKVALDFPESGKRYILTISKPRPVSKRKAPIVEPLSSEDVHAKVRAIRSGGPPAKRKQRVTSEAA